jgi:hypothetical protein
VPDKKYSANRPALDKDPDSGSDIFIQIISHLSTRQQQQQLKRSRGISIICTLLTIMLGWARMRITLAGFSFLFFPHNIRRWQKTKKKQRKEHSLPLAIRCRNQRPPFVSFPPLHYSTPVPVHRSIGDALFSFPGSPTPSAVGFQRCASSRMPHSPPLLRIITYARTHALSMHDCTY